MIAEEMCGIVEMDEIDVVDVLVDLNSVDELIRRAAYQILLDAGEEVIPALVEQFDRISGAARLSTIRVFGEIGHPGAVDTLLAVMRSNDPGEYFLASSLAAQSLGRIGGSAAVQGLLETLETERAGVRRMAVVVLGTIGDGEAVPGLHAALDDDDQKVRELAARSLEQIGTPRALAVLDAWRNDS
jgi:HEAT repeat protein